MDHPQKITFAEMRESGVRRTCRHSVCVRVISMFEVAIALGLFGAGIFLAHMVAAYRAR
jgi:hypothetical protein